ncbi:MAG: M50 family metallopeptidase [Kofleriaceae bacterium]|nr:M50 family metallopeptidase [Myxococcales bacterium]MCB9564391.1 M50 family metallopeptidase [Kofleriaceae bacterium]MCB9574799.1 M50 family metallopeptidase [Kofleriaceae bacterium]
MSDGPWRAGELRGLALALVASLVLLQLPFGGVVLYPFKLLDTWLHEMSHGLVMLVTGVGFDRMEVYRDGSGLALANHTANAVGAGFIAAAGYMGTPLWGALLLWVGQEVRAAKIALIVMAVLLGGTTILFISNRFGQVAMGATAAVVLVAALVLPGRARVLLCSFVAAQACIGAIVDIRVLYRPSLVVNGEARGSDAHQMAMATFGTTDPWAIWVWASAWLAWSLAVLFVALWLARRRAGATRSPGDVPG